ncbi:spermatogenesis-associated protein 24-like [Ptychodera flava]|uniref:spermatogenesis-associated protein 24-like n=1 Tax=Ptychodera flava TaxID=63121 RepID=UPI00396A1100
MAEETNVDDSPTATELKHSTDVVVHTQLQDVIVAQRKAYERLKAKMESMESEMVSKTLYEKVIKDLEEEKIAHAKTKAKLLSESDKLQFALGEIEILSKQLEREKTAFEQVVGQMKSKVLKDSAKNVELVHKCTEIEAQCEEQEDILYSKNATITDLKQRLAKQKENHKHELTEMEIRVQQEAYIAKTLGCSDKPKKPSSQSHRV